MNRIRIFISSVQREFAQKRKALRDYLRGDPLMRRFFDDRIHVTRETQESTAAVPVNKQRKYRTRESEVRKIGLRCSPSAAQVQSKCSIRCSQSRYTPVASQRLSRATEN